LAGCAAEVAVLEAVAVALEGEDLGVVDEPVDHRDRDVVIAEDLAPGGERLVAGDDQTVISWNSRARPERFELPTFGSVDRLQPAGTLRYGRLAQLRKPSNAGVGLIRYPRRYPFVVVVPTWYPRSVGWCQP